MLMRSNLWAKVAANIEAPKVVPPLPVGASVQAAIAPPPDPIVVLTVFRADKKRRKNPAATSSSSKKPRVRVPSPTQGTGDGSSTAQIKDISPGTDVGPSSPTGQFNVFFQAGLPIFPFPKEGISPLESFY